MGLSYNNNGTASWNDLISGSGSQGAQQTQHQPQRIAIKYPRAPTSTTTAASCPSTTTATGPKTTKERTPRSKLAGSKHFKIKSNLRSRPSLNEARLLHRELP